MTVAITFAGACLVGCGKPADPDETAIVEGTGTGPTSVSGKDVWVQLPTGRLVVTVGTPVDVIPASETHAEPIKASDDEEHFIPIDIQTEPLKGVPAGVWPLGTEDPVEPELALVIDGATFKLNPDEDDDGNPESLSGAHYVAATWSGRDPSIRLSATYAGVQQSISTTGQRKMGEAESLYDVPAPQRVACDDGWTAAPKSARPEVDITCDYTAFYYPYLPEKGWASQETSGATWTVLWASTRVDALRLGKPSKDCVLGRGTGTLMLDGRKPDIERDLGGSGSTVASWAAFAVSASGSHELRLARSQSCRVGSEDHVVRLESKVEVTPLGGP